MLDEQGAPWARSAGADLGHLGVAELDRLRELREALLAGTCAAAQLAAVVLDVYAGPPCRCSAGLLGHWTPT